ncbi:MAG: purine/pyrimidine permease [Erysipelotrichaceae bacterium]|jgi:NCS2 family nucleobase:cation symporter-2|nr:purine/pyrimidine permease [Erysipelotrichaceae bacterium]
MFKKLKAFFASRDKENLFRIDGAVPFKNAIPVGIQHVLAMFVANVTPILIVFGAVKAGDPGANVEAAIMGSIFIAGIGTIIQLFSFWRIGARLPIVVGVSFTFVGVLAAVTSQYGYGTMVGSTIVGGVIIGILGLFAKYWRKFIKPIVSSIVILAIGLSLMPVGINQFLNGNQLFGADSAILSIGETWPFLLIGFITLFSYLFYANLFKNWVKTLSILLSLVTGYLVALILNFAGFNTIDFSSLQFNTITDYISYPQIIDLSIIKFDISAIILVTLIYLVASTEAIGDISALTYVSEGRVPTEKEISGGIASDGFVSAFASLFGSLPLTTFSQNIGIVKETKICNRFTILMGAIALVIISFFPPLAKVIRTIPDPVLGGCLMILFTSIAITAIEMISQLGFTKKNVLILSVSLALGYGLSLVGETNLTKFFGEDLNYLTIIISNPVATMFIISFVMSFIIKDEKKPEIEEPIAEEVKETGEPYNA